MSFMPSPPCLLFLPSVLFHMESLYYCLPWTKPDLRKPPEPLVA